MVLVLISKDVNQTLNYSYDQDQQYCIEYIFSLNCSEKANTLSSDQFKDIISLHRVLLES